MVRGGWHNVTFKELYWFNEQNFPLSRQKAMEIFQRMEEKMQKGMDTNGNQTEIDQHRSGNG